VPPVRRRSDHVSLCNDQEEVQVRHVQPYEAVKAYRCPGCGHDIPPGSGHEVVVPPFAPDDRRHWHTGCWYRERRRRDAAR
jgi:hypothetical protein